MGAAAPTLADGSLAGAGARDSIELVRHNRGYHSDVIMDMLEEVYTEVGVPVNIRRVPGRQAIAEIASHMVDGDVARVAGFEKRFPHLQKVGPPVSEILTTGFIMNDSGLEEVTPEQLVWLRVGFVAGTLHADRATQNVLERVEVQSPDNLFALLRYGRIDVAVHSGIGGRLAIASHGWDDIKTLPEPLARAPIHHYLDRKYAALATKVARGMADRMRSGVWQRRLAAFRDKVVAEARKPNS